jgi:hypothetical protein
MPYFAVFTAPPTFGRTSGTTSLASLFHIPAPKPISLPTQATTRGVAKVSMTVPIALPPVYVSGRAPMGTQHGIPLNLAQIGLQIQQLKQGTAPQGSTGTPLVGVQPTPPVIMIPATSKTVIRQAVTNIGEQATVPQAGQPMPVHVGSQTTSPYGGSVGTPIAPPAGIVTTFGADRGDAPAGYQWAGPIGTPEALTLIPIVTPSRGTRNIPM